LRRRISTTILIALTAAFAVAIHGCSRAGEEDEYETLTFDLNAPGLTERLGQDDGYAFAIFYGADIHGSLETCG
jgi:hypothetical protein